MNEAGVRQEIVTYALRDDQGMSRGQGLPSEAVARETAQRILEDSYATSHVVIERVVFVSYRDVQSVAKVERSA